jgi:hypothetical protein
MGAEKELRGTLDLREARHRIQIRRVTASDAIETAILRRMTAAQKLAVLHALWRQAWELKAAGIRVQHPEWTHQQVEARVRDIFFGAAS